MGGFYAKLLILELNAKPASYVALDKSNGQTCGSPVLTKVDGVDCAVFMGGGAVVGVNAATGQELWRHGTWGHAWMGPVVSGDKIFVANASLPRGCGMIQIIHGKPTVIWEDKKKFQTLHCNSVIWQGHIYGFDNTGTDYQGKDSQKSSLKCLQLDTGEVKWVKEKMGWGNLIIAPDRIGGGNLIILREAGDLIVARASAESYQELLRNKILDGQWWAVPAFSEGNVYCRNNSGDVVCLQLFGPPTAQLAPTVSRGQEPAKSPGSRSPEKVETRNSKVELPLQTTPGQWPRFRGPGGLGVVPHQIDNCKLKIENWRWKVPVPLAGQSSPVVWDKYVFLTGANKERREVYCFDADCGKLIWQKEVAPSAMGTAQMPKDDIVLAARNPSPVTRDPSPEPRGTSVGDSIRPANRQ